MRFDSGSVILMLKVKLSGWLVELLEGEGLEMTGDWFAPDP
jgi:hypothetical protein